MSEPEWLLCAVSGARLRVPGSVDRDCSLCGCSVVVAPSGLRRLLAGAVCVCAPCGLAMIGADPDPRFVPLAPDQVGEIVGFLRRN